MAQDSLIIDLADFAEYKDIGSNIDSTQRLEPYIRMAQRLDIVPLLGGAMYYDVITNGVDVSPLPTIYDDLINGTTYSNTQNQTIFFEGLEPCLVYFSYARFLISDNTHSTRKGFVYKGTEQSERISQSELKQLALEARNTALAYQTAVVNFLTEKTAVYTLWQSALDYRPKRQAMNVFTVNRNTSPPSTRINNASIDPYDI